MRLANVNAPTYRHTCNHRATRNTVSYVLAYVTTEVRSTSTAPAFPAGLPLPSRWARRLRIATCDHCSSSFNLLLLGHGFTLWSCSEQLFLLLRVPTLVEVWGRGVAGVIYISKCPDQTNYFSVSSSVV